jgi:hypothetical protein
LHGRFLLALQFIILRVFSLYTSSSSFGQELKNTIVVPCWAHIVHTCRSRGVTSSWGHRTWVDHVSRVCLCEFLLHLPLIRIPRCIFGPNLSLPMASVCSPRRQYTSLLWVLFSILCHSFFTFNIFFSTHSACTCTGYKKFVSDYVLNVGDRIMFDFENEPELFGIIPEERDAYENHRVEGNYLFFLCLYMFIPFMPMYLFLI